MFELYRPTFGSLFSGIGGMDIGLEMAGFEVKWQVEIDPFRQAVLKKHWPHVPKFCDIKNLRGDELEKVDLICGGPPCQPFSIAGKRRGTSDNRYLWPEMFRIIKAIRPSWVLFENVANIVNMAIDIVLSDLEAEGYETGTLIIPACAVGAPHRRDRVWILAYTCGKRLPEPEQKWQLQRPATERGWREAQSGLGNSASRLPRRLPRRLAGHRWPAPYGCEQHEWEPPRAVTGKVPYRKQKLQALGDAVVPQVVYAIGIAILK